MVCLWHSNSFCRHSISFIWWAISSSRFLQGCGLFCSPRRLSTIPLQPALSEGPTSLPDGACARALLTIRSWSLGLLALPSCPIHRAASEPHLRHQRQGDHDCQGCISPVAGSVASLPQLHFLNTFVWSLTKVTDFLSHRGWPLETTSHCYGLNYFLKGTVLQEIHCIKYFPAYTELAGNSLFLCVFLSLRSHRRRILRHMKMYEIQISVSTNKALLELSHVRAFQYFLRLVSHYKRGESKWPAKPKILTIWPSSESLLIPGMCH